MKYNTFEEVLKTIERKNTYMENVRFLCFKKKSGCILFGFCVLFKILFRQTTLKYLHLCLGNLIITLLFCISLHESPNFILQHKKTLVQSTS